MPYLIFGGGPYGNSPEFPNPLPQDVHVAFIADSQVTKFLVLPRPTAAIHGNRIGTNDSIGVAGTYPIIITASNATVGGLNQRSISSNFGAMTFICDFLNSDWLVESSA